MDLSVSASFFPRQTNPADVPGGCAGAPEPIRGCDRACVPAKVLTHAPLRTTAGRGRGRGAGGSDPRRVRLHAGVSLSSGEASGTVQLPTDNSRLPAPVP